MINGSRTLLIMLSWESKTAKNTTRNVKNFSKHSNLLKITEDPSAYVKEAIRKMNDEYCVGKVSYEMSTDFNERAKHTDEEASSSTGVNIGYFFLQDIMKGLNLKKFFQEKTLSRRNTSVLYYDCTNFYFECEQPDEDIVDEVTGEVISGLRKYGLSIEHRPNPIVEMALFMDRKGNPITMCLHPGNTSKQITAVPLEEEVLKMLDGAKFIYCADDGLGSYNIRNVFCRGKM